MISSDNLSKSTNQQFLSEKKFIKLTKKLNKLNPDIELYYSIKLGKSSSINTKLPFEIIMSERPLFTDLDLKNSIGYISIIKNHFGNTNINNYSLIFKNGSLSFEHPNFALNQKNGFISVNEPVISQINNSTNNFFNKKGYVIIDNIDNSDIRKIKIYFKK